MPNPVTSIKETINRLSALARLHIELAKLELKQKLTALGVGIGLVVAAAVLLVFMLGFLFATIAAGLATFLPWWLALLIVTVLLSALAMLCILIAMNRFKRATPLTPTEAIAEAQRTAEMLRGR
jgi:protein-S-isoprenylcysteine O-methyltransferase Ste14